MTDAGALLGTVAYMAPEQARGADGLDACADVFALGYLLFECLTGQTPFAAVHATAVLTKILFEDTPRLRQRLPSAPEALDALLGRMLSKQPRNGRRMAGLRSRRCARSGRRHSCPSRSKTWSSYGVRLRSRTASSGPWPSSSSSVLQRWPRR